MARPDKPKVFIGSAASAIDIAQVVEGLLKYQANVYRWDHIFQQNKGNLENIIAKLKEMDFAVLILTPDDVTSVGSGGGGEGRPKFNTPRDNVVFELGLFMGRLGRERTFGLVKENERPKLPSDLAGVSLCEYLAEHSDTDLVFKISPACTPVLNAIRTLGNFPGRDEVNPHYEADLARLDGTFNIPSVINDQSVVIVVGGGPVCELLDRPVASALRDHIDRHGGADPFRRAIIMSHAHWSGTSSLHGLPTIALAAVHANPLTGEVAAAWKAAGFSPWPEGTGHAAFAERTSTVGPRVAIWGGKAAETRGAVESWRNQPQGLSQFLRKDAKWG